MSSGVNAQSKPESNLKCSLSRDLVSSCLFCIECYFVQFASICLFCDKAKHFAGCMPCCEYGLISMTRINMRIYYISSSLHSA